MSHNKENEKDLFGFWIYIMSDCVLFSILFAVYIVLKDNVYGGPSAKDLFSMPYVLAETMILLFSSFTYGLAMLFARDNRKNLLLVFLGITFCLGCSFMYLEIKEFIHLIHAGHGWTRSGFLSGFFTLVGTHGLHVSFGLIWMIIVMIKIYSSNMTNKINMNIMLLGLFWHFLDVIWICVFTIVYLMGNI